MSPLFKKLNLGAQVRICVLNAPASFEPELAALQDVVVSRSPANGDRYALAFAVTQAELDAASASLAAACEGNAVLWIAYPKRTSKRYKCEFNRDSGWAVLGSAGFEPVRMVAIDDDWSALRFRRVEHVKAMKRVPANAVSPVGQRRAVERGS